jgi:hypothetical protein
MQKMHRKVTFLAMIPDFRSNLYDFNENAPLTLRVCKSLHFQYQNIPYTFAQ